MKIFTHKSLFKLLLLVLVSKGFTDNPIVQNNYTADPAPMVYKDQVFIYSSHDEDRTEEDFYTMRNYCCYSTKDMVNWTDHGIIASLKNFSWLGGTNNGAWAPQCIERNGKFYLYIPIHGKGIGVLVGDSPVGPFKDPIGKGLIARGNWSDIDPTVFIDSDGQAYLYWGNGDLWYVKLNEDMISYSGSIVTSNPKPTGYTEGPWLTKHGSQYYMIYAGMGNGAENIQYSMSNSPAGPWTSKGVIMPTQGTSFTNHPGVCDFKDNSYFFYHNSSLAGGGSYKRSVCLEQFTYKDDGTIPSMTMSKSGPDQVGALNPYDTIQAETFCWEEGVETESCTEGGMDVSSIENGDYIKLKGVDFGSGAKLFEARVASNTSGGKIELHLDSQTGTLIGTCTVSGTGDSQKWETKTCEVTGASEKHDLFIKFTGGSGSLFNFNWWRFSPATDVNRDNMHVQQMMKNSLVLSKNGNSIIFTFNMPEKIFADRLTMQLSDLKGRRINCRPSVNCASGKVAFSIDKKAVESGMYVLDVCSGNKEIFKHSCLLQ